MFKKLAVPILVLLLIVAPIYGYISNLVKFSECDFQAPYKAEIIHGIGIIPVVGVFTGYLDVGK